LKVGFMPFDSLYSLSKYQFSKLTEASAALKKMNNFKT